MNEHQLRLQGEVAFYEDHKFNHRHILNRWPFYSQARARGNYAIAWNLLLREAKRAIPNPSNVLIAPCGQWGELPLLRSIWPSAKFVGIDIVQPTRAVQLAFSPEETKEAERQIRKHIGVEVSNFMQPGDEAYIGDMLRMPFADHSFDVVSSVLFFHHIVDEGFAPYLKEIRRVLRPGGGMISLEPNVGNPATWLAIPARKIFGNITGQVPHERAISMNQLAKSCHAAGFSKVSTFAGTYVHSRVPVPLRGITNAVLSPFKQVAPLKFVAFLMGIVANA